MVETDWTTTEADALCSSLPAGGALVGFPLWGDQFIERFLRYCLPSIDTHQDMALVVYTDAAGMSRLRPRRLPIILRELPSGFTDRFCLLKAVQEALIEALIAAAGQSGMGFVAMQPDVVLQDCFIQNLLDLSVKHEVILGACPWVTAPTFLSDLARHKGLLTQHTLAELSWKHLHPMWRLFLMNNVDIDVNMPLSHYLAWQGHGYVRVHCSHLNPLWISSRLCRSAVNLPHSLDAALGSVMGDVVPHMITPRDGLCHVEFANVGSKPSHMQPTSFDSFAKYFWSNAPNMSLFEKPVYIPIGPQGGGMSEEEINVAFNAVRERLLGYMIPR